MWWPTVGLAIYAFHCGSQDLEFCACKFLLHLRRYCISVGVGLRSSVMSSTLFTNFRTWHLRLDDAILLTIFKHVFPALYNNTFSSSECILQYQVMICKLLTIYTLYSCKSWQFRHGLTGYKAANIILKETIQCVYIKLLRSEVLSLMELRLSLSRVFDVIRHFLYYCLILLLHNFMSACEFWQNSAMSLRRSEPIFWQSHQGNLMTTRPRTITVAKQDLGTGRKAHSADYDFLCACCLELHHSQELLKWHS